MIELLIVTSILAVISLAVFTTLNNGIKLWQFINQETLEEDIALFLSRISSDLRNCFIFSDIEFVGTEEDISFSTILKRQVEGLSSPVGRVNYFLDDFTINRTTQNYSEIYQDQIDAARKLISPVKSFSFCYYYYDPIQKKFFWTGAWPIGKLSESKIGRIPLAVKVEINLTSNVNTYSKTISIPSSR